MEYLHIGWNRVYENTVGGTMCLHLSDNFPRPVPIIFASAPSGPEPTSVAVNRDSDRLKEFMDNVLDNLHPTILPQGMR
jgi:hypothetical protein